MWKSKITILILLLASASCSLQSKTCQSLLQIPGKCTGCQQDHYFHQGRCYQKTKGCNQYIALQLCVTCQFGYTLKESSCIKDFEVQSGKNTKNKVFGFSDHPTDSGSTIKLSSNLKLTRSHYSFVSLVNEYFRNSKKELERGIIFSIGVLEIDQGIIVQIVYICQLAQFQAAAKINYFNQTEQLFFLQLDDKITLSINQLNADSLSRFASQTQNSSLQNIQLNLKQNKVQMFYRSEDRTKLYKIQHSLDKSKRKLLSISQVAQKATLEKAKKVVLFFAPELTRVKVKLEKQNLTDQSITYQIVYTNGAYINIVLNKASKKYEIHQYIVEAPQNPENTARGSRPLPGGFFPLKNYLDANFLAAKQYLYKNYPQLKKIQIIKAEIQLVSGVNIKITFYDPIASLTYIAIASKPLIGQIQIRNITKNQQNILRQKKSNTQIETLLGGFTKIQDQKDYNLKAIVQKIKAEHPQLKNSIVEAAGFQVVSGLNYKVIMIQRNDTYVFDIYQNLYRQIFILNARKNGQPYLVQAHQQDIQFDWAKDQKFEKGYEFFKKEINIVNFLPIQQVSKVQKGNEVIYTIIYSTTEFGIFKHTKDTNQFQVVSYTFQGTQLYQSRSSKKIGQDKQRTVKEILQFLKTNKSQYFSNAFLKSFRKSFNFYTLEVASPKGVFEVQIEDSKIIIVKKLKLLSKHNCFEVSEQQIKSDETIKKVINYTRKTMNIQEPFQLQILQTQVNANFLTYRLLFKNLFNKKLQIYVNFDSQGIRVKQSEVINYGYENIPFQQLSDILLKANPIAKKLFKEKLFNSQMVDAKKNLTNVKLVYSNKQFTHQVILSQDLAKAVLKDIQDKRPKLPRGFKSENIIKTSEVEQTQFYKVLMQKINNKFGKYVLNAPIILLQSQIIAGVNSLKLLFDSQYGIFQAIGRHTTKTNEIQLSSFLLTNIRKSSFLQCNSLKDQSCLICRQDEIYSDGRCFEKIQGCQLQVGNVCINCSEKWIQVDKICRRDCAQLF